MDENLGNNGALMPAPVANAVGGNNDEHPLELPIFNTLSDIGRALSTAQKTEEEKQAIADSITAFFDAVEAGDVNAQLGFQAPNIGPDFTSDKIETFRDNIRALIDSHDADAIERIRNDISIVTMMGLGANGFNEHELEQELNALVANQVQQQGAQGQGAQGQGGQGQGGQGRKRKTRRGRRSSRRRRSTRRRRVSRRH